MTDRTDTVHISTITTSKSAPSANFHYARMRCAEDAARSLSVQHSVRMFTGGSTPNKIADLRARRDSYYLLAAAHRNAARKRQRAENRALAWSVFREGPALYVRATLRSWSDSIRRAVTR